jgi:hypothetical protein
VAPEVVSLKVTTTAPDSAGAVAMAGEDTVFCWPPPPLVEALAPPHPELKTITDAARIAEDVLHLNAMVA